MLLFFSHWLYEILSSNALYVGFRDAEVTAMNECERFVHSAIQVLGFLSICEAFVRAVARDLATSSVLCCQSSIYLLAAADCREFGKRISWQVALQCY